MLDKYAPVEIDLRKRKLVKQGMFSFFLSTCRHGSFGGVEAASHFPSEWTLNMFCREDQFSGKQEEKVTCRLFQL